MQVPIMREWTIVYRPLPFFKVHMESIHTNFRQDLPDSAVRSGLIVTEQRYDNNTTKEATFDKH